MMDYKNESSEDKQKRLGCYVGRGINRWDCYSDCAFWNGTNCTRFEETETEKLKPCPFCGGETKIAVCDSEGNLHDDDYEQNPWSGLGYQLIHTIEENEGCPIAKYDCDGAEMGVYIYGSKEEAIEAWNRRAT